MTLCFYSVSPGLKLTTGVRQKQRLGSKTGTTVDHRLLLLFSCLLLIYRTLAVVIIIPLLQSKNSNTAIIIIMINNYGIIMIDIYIFILKDYSGYVIQINVTTLLYTLILVCVFPLCHCFFLN